MVWFVSSITFAMVVFLLIAGVMLVFGFRFLQEFTRPGVTVEQGTPQWGGWTFPQAAPEPSAEWQRALTFQTADGALLHGEFWAQTGKAPTMIISHGFHLPSVYFRSVAALAYAHGANVFLFDYRGHGKSAPILTTCGNAEVNDLAAAVDAALSQAETASNQIFIHGFSMGAAVALLLPPQAAIGGIIADSSYARLDEMLHLLIRQFFDEKTAKWPGLARIRRALLPSLTHLTLLGGKLLFYARYRRSLIARPDQAIGAKMAGHVWLRAGAKAPPILLIHARHDPLIALDHAQRLVTAARAAGRSIQAYFTPSALHCGSYGHDPHQYITLLKKFVKLEGSKNASILPQNQLSIEE